MELLEKGRVRFWTQVEKCTSNCTVEYVFNDVIITEGKVGMILKKSNMSYVVLFVHLYLGLSSKNKLGFSTSFASRNTQ